MVVPTGPKGKIMGLVGDDLLQAIDRAEKECRSGDVKLFLELANVRCKERRLDACFHIKKPEDLRSIPVNGWDFANLEME
jgi:hypothetical protein